MFISVLELFKIGIGPSSSHTMGPMTAARDFMQRVEQYLFSHTINTELHLRCTLKGSLAYTGKGHGSDHAIALGLHGYSPDALVDVNINQLLDDIESTTRIELTSQPVINTRYIQFWIAEDIIFDLGKPLPQHPNGMIFELKNSTGDLLLTQTYFSIGGGFINTLSEITALVAPIKMLSAVAYPYPFTSADMMLEMSQQSGLSIAAMKQKNELHHINLTTLNDGMDNLWNTMKNCIQQGLVSEGNLPGGLDLPRRARGLFNNLKQQPEETTLNDWLCAYAMAVNEENAAGHVVVTAPTNGAAGVIPAVLYFFVKHHNATAEQVREFLLTAAAIGGIIKHKSSISGAEVGCQGEVGSAAAMAAAGLCAIKGGSAAQVENAAEIALEHHLGMTCDPVKGLVQIPCIERNGFGAIKAYTAASLALHGSGDHFMSLDNCIAAMKQTGQEMSHKFKETSLGGLAVSYTEC